jgi:sterol desaturase/sphingolipid hydroxylase (fatty acid hydroxylase superfamily)
MSIAADAVFTMPRTRRFPRWAIWALFPAYAGLLAAAWAALGQSVPDQVTLSLLGHSKTLAHVHDRILGDGVMVLAILPFVLWLECAVIGWEKSSARALLRPSASAATDLSNFLLEQLHVTGLIGKLMMLGASLVSGEMLRAWLLAKTGLAVNLSALPLAAQVPLCFIAYTFFDYWAHRAGHSRLFWPLHRYHHAATEMVVINGGRLHPAGFLGIFFLNLPMPLLGAGAQTMLWVNLAVTVLGFLIHSRLETDFGWVGRYVLQSPRHHRLHHKLDMTEATGFFAMMPVWDRLFGGWLAQDARNVAIGVDTQYRHGFWIAPDLLRDYRDFWLGLIGRRSYSASER